MSQKARTKYRELRARLIRKGYTLRSFARSFGFNEQTVYSAAQGKRAGVVSVQIQTKLEEIAYAE